MSLASLESELLQLVVDALEDCDLEVPDEVLRHHGPHPTLPGCCTEAGVLSAYWEEVPRPAPCEPTEWAIALKWSTCWPEDVDPIDYASRDATSARIADVAECVLNALAREVCTWGGGSRLFPHAATLKLGRVTPIYPGGRCAGVVWRIVATVRRPESPAT